MSRGGRQFVGPWSLVVIALAIAGAGLDALPATLLLDTRTHETSQDDADDPSDAEDVVDGSWLESSSPAHVRRRRAMPAWVASPLDLFDGPASQRAMTHAEDVGIPPRSAILLCRFRC